LIQEGSGISFGMASGKPFETIQKPTALIGGQELINLS